jgi:hypothetical protein
MTYKEELKLRKQKFAEKNEARKAVLAKRKEEKELEKVKKAQEKINTMVAAGKKVPPGLMAIASSIKPEKFNEASFKAGANGFYVSEYDVDKDEDFLDDNNDNFPDEMGFSIFGVEISTDSLLNKATSLAETQINKYLSPPPTNTTVIQQPAPPITTTQTNVISQPMFDEQTMKMLKTGGIALGGLVGVALVVKIFSGIIGMGSGRA